MTLAQPLTFSASQITSGVLDIARIPDLPASKITSGTLDVARIPDLAASKITSGVLDVARIPSLPASQINSGVFDNARINWGSPSAIGNVVAAAGTFTAIAGSTISVGPATNITSTFGQSALHSAQAGFAHFSHQAQTGSTVFALRQSNAAVTIVNGTQLQLAINAGPIAYVFATGFSVGVNAQYGTSAAFSATVANAGREVMVGRGFTSQTANLLELQKQSAATKVFAVGANGVIEAWQPPNTGNNVQVGSITPVMPVTTTISYEGGLALYGQGFTGQFEGLRVVAGSAAKIGVLGATPSARIAIGSWGGMTADQRSEALRDALTTFGWISWVA